MGSTTYDYASIVRALDPNYDKPAVAYRFGRGREFKQGPGSGGESAVARAYRRAVQADSPVGYWRQGERSGSIADKSGNSVTGTATGAPTYIQTGAIHGNDAILYDGSSDSFDLGANFQYERTQAFTVETWFKGTASGSFIGNLNSAASYSGWALAVSAAGALVFKLINTSGSNEIIQASSGVNLLDGAYHLVAATYDGSATAAGVTFYVSGAAIASAAPSADTLSATTVSAANTSLGNNGSDDFFAGTLDESAVYASELSAARLLAHFNAAS